VALAACKTGVKRLVFMSSFAVYGRADVVTIDETIPLNPRSEYGRTKAAAERILLSFVEKDLDVRILRPCGTYGPLRVGMGSQSARLIESLLLGVRHGMEMTLETAVGRADEFIYVRSLAQAVALAALRDLAIPDRVFNVGVGYRTTAEELRDAVLGVFPNARITIKKTKAESPASVPPLNMQRIRDALGFESRFGLVEGLADYIREAGLTL
jgi:nucleoside-diphosphate-sugar epimerase